MRLGVLGGTFDPIHWGHLLLAEVSRDRLQLGRILFVPAGDPPHKQHFSKTPGHHRQEMVKLAISDNPYFALSTVDLNRPGPHYSIDTVRLIRTQYDITADQCFFIIGSDSLVELPTWHKPEELVGLCRLAVAHRANYQPNIEALELEISGLESRLDWLAAPVLDLASSTIRDWMAAGRSIRYQVPEAVREYIKQQGLYSP